MVDYTIAVQTGAWLLTASLLLRPGKIKMGVPSGGRLNRDVWEVEKEAPRQLLSSLPLQEAGCPSLFLPLYLFPLFLCVFPKASS